MFVSTRDASALPHTFEQCLFRGLADDGGMFLPATLPAVSLDTLRSWAPLTYQQLCCRVLSLFISDREIPAADVERIVGKAFQRFTTDDIVPLKPLPATDASEDSVSVAELWHGPTLAFKDLALQMMGHMIDFFLAKSGRRATILVGTSGDTGSAAIHAVLGCEQVDIVVLYPHGRTSKTQELQMSTVSAPNVHVVGVDGTSDDLDVPIRNVFNDAAFCAEHSIMSANSINVARILIQTVQFFYSYLQLDPSCGRTLTFVIPTGAAGHLVSGVIAKLCGLPIGAICAATNTNDIVHKFIATGLLSMSDAVIPTTSPSMDIQYPYNVERLFYYFTRGDTALVTEWMRSFASSGKVELPEAFVKEMHGRFGLRSCCAEESEVLDAVRATWRKHGYMLCPHTAVGAVAASTKRASWGYNADTQGPLVLFATAHAAKFTDTITACLGVSVDDVLATADSPAAAALRELVTKPPCAARWDKPSADWQDAWTDRLREVVRCITAAHTAHK